MEFDSQNGWVSRCSKEDPVIPVSITVCKEAYKNKPIPADIEPNIKGCPMN